MKVCDVFGGVISRPGVFIRGWVGVVSRNSLNSTLDVKSASMILESLREGGGRQLRS